MKIKKKGKLKATFIEAAQILRNILVQEPANKHRVKREIFEAKKAGKPIEDYHPRLLDGQAVSGVSMTLSGIPLLAVGGLLSLTVAPWFIIPGMLLMMSCLALGCLGVVKIKHLASGKASARMTRRFERQVERKLKRLQKAQNKRARQRLLSSDI